MKQRLFTLMLLLASCICYAQNKNYKTIKNGVIIILKPGNANPAKLVKLEVINNNIIHVLVSNSNRFSTEESLIVPDKTFQPVKYTTSTTADTLLVSTSSITAKVSLTSGEVVFYDKSGRVKLKEQQGGRTFAQSKNGERDTYNIRQVFTSPDDEAFYGLGQHQSGVFNYKGQNVELMQRNTEVAIPFLISNKNYGLLWDNNSLTRFGDPREYAHINTMKLYSADGKPGALTAKYFVDSNNTRTLFKEQPETEINYEFREQKDKWLLNFPAKNGAVEWTGFLASEYNGLHKFFLQASGYIKVWLDGKPVVDAWKQIWLPGNFFFDLNMEKDKKYSIRVEWKGNDFGNGPYIALKWLSPVPSKEQNNLSLSSEAASNINYYFINGNNADDVIRGYRQLTGKASMMPQWAMGLWQSRDRYLTQTEVVDVVKEYRKRNIPLDNIVQDWQYWKADQWGSHEFDATRFPDADKMIKEIHDYHAHFMISVWPKFYEKTDNYKAFAKNGWAFKRNIELQTRDWVNEVYTFYDPFSAGARKLFWQQVDNRLFKKGVDAWWMDATEPELISNVSNEEKISRMNPTAMGSGAKYINAFPLMNSKAVYEGQRQSDANKRVFILTRSAFAGQQRYGAATWSGDITARWHDLKNQIPAGLNFSLSGIPYWTFDIGGYEVEKRYVDAKGNDEEFRELFARYFQLGAFCPLFRIHGKYPYREIYNIAPEGHPVYNTLVKYDKLRYRLMPYIYSLAGKTWKDDYTIMRALLMDFPHDKKVWSIADEYMFGSALLVCPVYEYKATTRQVYLPSTSGWYDASTGKYYNGEQTITADAPISKMPLYVREGSIIPVGPQIQYAMEKTSQPLTVYVYTGKSCSFTLYEDEGINYNYEKGAYTEIPFSYNEQMKTLVIEARKGKFNGMDAVKKISVVWITKDKPRVLAEENATESVLTYNGKKLTVKQ